MEIVVVKIKGKNIRFLSLLNFFEEGGFPVAWARTKWKYIILEGKEGGDKK